MKQKISFFTGSPKYGILEMAHSTVPKLNLILLTLAFCLLSTLAFSQAPQAFPYQAVARNSSGVLLANQNISIRFSILDGSNVGTVVYKETQNTTTNSLGLFNVNIGQGIVVSGTFSAINWGSGSKFIKVELDATGGNAYTVMGTTQLLSVPYALYANVPGVAGPQGLQGIQGIAGTNGVNGAGYSATSSSSITIALGSKTFTTQTGLAYLANNRVRVANSASNYMEGIVTSYSGSTLIVNVDRIVGSGTFASWNIGIAGDVGAAGVAGAQGIQGIQGATGPQGIQGIQGPAGAGGMANGTIAGNTTYWNGTAWVVNNNNLFNNGGSIGMGTNTPDASAKLDISSTTQGVLIPRMTTTQRDAIPTPATGLQVFNVDDQCIDLYDGTNWIKTCGMKVTGIVNDPYHIFPNSWAPKASLTGSNRNSAIAFSIGGKAYLGLGTFMNMLYYNDFYEYDPSTNAWTQKANFPGGMRADAVAFSIGGKGYVTTGGNGMFSNYDMWEYDPTLDTWTQKSNCPGSARYKAQGFAIGTKGYLGLGTDGTNDLNDFWEYNPANDTWTQKANYPGSGRRYTMGLSVNGKGYIGLGTDINGNYPNDVWEYNPATNAWIAKQAFPGGGFHSMACFSMNNKGYVGTGYNGANDMTDFWEYNAATDVWTSKAIYTGGGRKNAVGFAVGNKGYIATGFASINSSPLNDVWEYMDDLTVGNSYSSSTIASNNSVSDGAWTLLNNQVYNSNSGNVGIGTSFPANKLSVSGNADVSGNLGVGTLTPTNKLSVNGQADFTGNVGIGTISPSNKLSVVGNANITGKLGIGTSSPTSQFQTTGDVRHEALSGTGTRPLFVEANGKLVVYKDTIIGSNNTPQVVPSNTSCGSASSSIVVSGFSGTIPSGNISVTLNMTTSNTFVYKIYLIAPNGQKLNLINSGGGGPNFTNTTITDNAASTIPFLSAVGQPFTGSYKPSGVSYPFCDATTISTFGEIGGGAINPNGTWTLKVVNHAWAQTGTLDNWSLRIGNIQVGVGGYVPKWNNSALTPTSNIFDDGTNVGIGTATPADKLSVNGNTDISGNLGIGVTAPTAPLQFPNNSQNKKIALWTDSPNENQFYGFGIGYSALRYQVGHTGADHVFYAGTSSSTSTELMRIAGTGKVSIGSVTTPGNYKLYVSGGILTERLKVAVNGTGNWADYVFADNYKLMPLDEVEAFVNKHNHLPNVPSANQMVESGIDVATVDAKLMEKIEELTLYIIELKKEMKREVKKLSDENASIKSQLKNK